MKKTNMRLGALIVFTVAALAVILLATWLAVNKINKNAEERCFEQLHDEAYEMGKEIEQRVAASESQLELVASMAADAEDLADAAFWARINDCIKESLFSRIEILLPDDELITDGGKITDVSGTLSYEEELADGAHISAREEDSTGDGGLILRHFMPIERGGKTTALLCGVIELAGMADQLIDQPYGGDAAAYIIDRDTGDFLLDTWHDELGNVWEFDARKMADGYDDSLLREGMQEGRSDYVVFVSQTTGSYLYFYYTPIGVEHWSVALSVPEDVVFAQAQATRSTLNGFLAVEICCFVLYLLGMLLYVRFEVRYEMREKERQMNVLNSVYDVERLLFNAHENSDLVSAALERAAGMLEAERMDYWMLTQPGYDVLFSWNRPDCGIVQNDFAAERQDTNEIIKYFYKADRDSLTDISYISNAKARGIHSMLAVPVRKANGEQSGILAAYNLPANEDSLTLLRGLEVSFEMFCRNMSSYQSVKEQSERDVLTGLYNRNRYTQDAADCRSWYKNGLACVYLDANGLHELNNSQGHAAGDRMLRTVAKAIKKHFGDEHAYRIGGDEFLAFVPDCPVAKVQALADACAAEINDAGYDVAVGVELAQHVAQTGPLVEAAEKRMYAAKRQFYALRASRAAR